MEPTPSLEHYWIHQFINSSRDLFQFSWAGVVLNGTDIIIMSYLMKVSQKPIERSKRTSKRKETRQSRKRTKEQKEKTAKKKRAPGMKNSRKYQSVEPGNQKNSRACNTAENLDIAGASATNHKETALHALEGERNRHKTSAASRRMIPRTVTRISLNKRKED